MSRAQTLHLVSMRKRICGLLFLAQGGADRTVPLPCLQPQTRLQSTASQASQRAWPSTAARWVAGSVAHGSTAVLSLTSSASAPPTVPRPQYNISLTQIDIGNASSDMTTRMTSGPGVKQADGSMRREPVMDREFAAREVRDIAELPLEVSKLWVVIQATGMPSMVGRG